MKEEKKTRSMRYVGRRGYSSKNVKQKNKCGRTCTTSVRIIDPRNGEMDLEE